MASETLRADASFEVTPPPVRVIAGARTGPSRTPGRRSDRWPDRRARAAARAARAPGRRILGRIPPGRHRQQRRQRHRNSTPQDQSISAPGGPCISALRCRARWSSPPGSTSARPGAQHASPPARRERPWPTTRSSTYRRIGAGSEPTYPLKPGWLAIGLRYLRIDLGRTSASNRISRNGAGGAGQSRLQNDFLAVLKGILR